MCVPLRGLRQFIWEDFPSSGCCFRSLILHSSACGWIGMWGAVCLTHHWPWTIDQVLLMNWKISSEVDFRQDEKRNYICLGVFGDFSFIIFFQHVYGFEFFYSNKAFLAMWQTSFFVVFFITFRQFFPCVGWSKIVCYVSVNFRRLKCDCDYGRGAATDIRGLCEELPHSHREQWTKEINLGQCYSYGTLNCLGCRGQNKSGWT